MKKQKKLSFSILDFIDSKDIREYNKDTQFMPFEQAVLIYHSRNTTVEQKLRAWQELMDTFTEEEFQQVKFTKNAEGGKPNIEFLQATVDEYNRALKDRYRQEDVIYQTKFWEHGFSNSPEIGYFKEYDLAYAHLKKLKQEYLDDDDLKDSPTRARIEVKRLNEGDRRDGDVFVFDNELRMVQIMADDGYDGLYGRAIYVPAPFKKGDLLKDISAEETKVAVLGYDVTWERYSNTIQMLQGEDMVLQLDCCFMDNDKLMFDYDEFEFLQLERCTEEDVPEELKTLCLLSDVYQGKMLAGDLLYLYSYYGKDAYRHIRE